jgi:hypothetical protein
LMPLHGERGGPLRCFMCAGAWNAEHTRRRKWGRIVIKAMKMFLKERGRYSDIDKLKLYAGGLGNFAAMFLPGYEDTIGTEVGDITSELLADTLQLTHPDHHPPERRELANRVTQQLLELKPFVFPAPKPPPPPPETKERDGSFDVREEPSKKPSQVYPCELCADTVPRYYCNQCKAESDKRWEAKRRREREKRRRWYVRRQLRRTAFQKPTLCQECGNKVAAKRKDARYCSAACRQRAHRRREPTVTAKPSLSPVAQSIRNGVKVPA